MANYSLEVVRNAEAEEWQIILHGQTNFIGKLEPMRVGGYENRGDAFNHLPLVQASLDKMVSNLDPDAELTKWQFRGLEQAAE